MANPVGRPSKYTPEILEKIDEYFSLCGTDNMQLPTKEGLALHLDIDGDTLVEWAKIHPDFSAATKKLEGLQKNQLMNDGMYGGKEVNSTMAIFLLKVNHGMVETEKRILAGDKENPPLQITIVEDKSARE